MFAGGYRLLGFLFTSMARIDGCALRLARAPIRPEPAGRCKVIDRGHGHERARQM